MQRRDAASRASATVHPGGARDARSKRDACSARAGQRHGGAGLKAASDGLRRALGLSAALVSTALAAQGAVPEAGDQPARDTGSSAANPAPTPPALEGYRRFDPDEPLLDWRAANAEAGRLGGHVGQLGSATENTPPAQPPAAQELPARERAAPDEAAPRQPAPHHPDHGAHR